MLSLAAYADRLSVRPNETIRFHVSSASGEPVRASIVRVICADANPNGPGIVTEPVTDSLEPVSIPAEQSVYSGSCGVVRDLPRLPAAWSIAVRVMPALSGKPQSLVSQLDDAELSGWSLALSEDNYLVALCGDGQAIREVARTSKPMPLNRWAFAWMTVSGIDQGDSTSISLGWQAYRRGQLVDDHSEGTSAASSMQPATNSPLVFAAHGRQSYSNHFNGRLEAPALFSTALNESERLRVATEPGSIAELASCHWDFADRPESDRITDCGPAARHGELLNTPVRAVKGAFWTGRNMVSHQAPDEYGAIHFHDDDLDNCHWPVCFEWTVPANTRSAVYALILQSKDQSENVPFHVVPPRGRTGARIAVLASTYTYTVYANNARPEWDADPAWRQRWHEQTAQWQAYPHNPGDHREYGLSTYNNHPDGSGISISSWHRPMLNVRLGYITYPDEPIRASGLRHFPADSHLYYWLENQGYDYDIITDAELDAEGFDLLSQYSVVLTGSHPEYHTSAMLNAIEKYRDHGGRFCYLGGNGFYWKIARKPGQDGIIEIRRGEGGIRAWAAEPGEYYNQFDGEYGGLWRRNGRPPQDLVGVGFTAQGNFSGSHYRVKPGAKQSRAAWILNGIEQETIGGHGLSAHGAAGFELDRADKNLGTPLHAVVLASSEDHPPQAPWILVPEEMLTHLLTWPHEPAQDLVRADMTFFETPNGGAIFSAGSITFCGSLLTNNCNNDMSTLLGNVLTRFLDPTPFEMPD